MATVLYAAAVISFRGVLRGKLGVLGSLLLSRSDQSRYQFSPLSDTLFKVLLQSNEAGPQKIPGANAVREVLEMDDVSNL